MFGLRFCVHLAFHRAAGNQSELPQIPDPQIPDPDEAASYPGNEGWPVLTTGTDCPMGTEETGERRYTGHIAHNSIPAPTQPAAAAAAAQNTQCPKNAETGETECPNGPRNSSQLQTAAEIEGAGGGGGGNVSTQPAELEPAGYGVNGGEELEGAVGGIGALSVEEGNPEEEEIDDLHVDQRSPQGMLCLIA